MRSERCFGLQNEVREDGDTVEDKRREGEEGRVRERFLLVCRTSISVYLLPILRAHGEK